MMFFLLMVVFCVAWVVARRLRNGRRYTVNFDGGGERPGWWRR